MTIRVPDDPKVALSVYMGFDGSDREAEDEYKTAMLEKHGKDPEFMELYTKPGKRSRDIVDALLMI